MDKISEKNYTKPFLRWAGGKSWLIKYLPSLLENLNYNSYHEPFLGGGAVFFSLVPKGESFLSDINEELINTYISIRDQCEAVIQILNTFTNNEEFYYKIRDAKFTDNINRAARFIYLNGTSFNGLYRVNLHGSYNVPYGFRATPFLNRQTLRTASMVLNNTNISVSDFDERISQVRKGDLVFLDPPYTTSHNNNGFIKYNQKLFSLDDQKRLNVFIEEINKKEAFYIMTNAANIVIEEIFRNCGRRIQINRASAIGGKNAKRGPVSEYIFTNIGE